MRHRRPALLLCAALLAASSAGADDMMTVRLGGHQYRLPRAIDDGDSDHPEPGQPETILLRADLPDLTPHDETPDFKGIPAFSGKMVEILAQAVAARPQDQPKVTPALERHRLQVHLLVLFTTDLKGPRPALVLAAASDQTGPHGPDLHRITAPTPWDPSHQTVYVNGPVDDPSDIIACGGGECAQTFLHNSAIFKATYGEHLVQNWAAIHARIAAMMDHAETRP